MGPEGAPNPGIRDPPLEKKLKIKTKMLISWHFSGYSELHRRRISSTRTRELTAMYTYSTVYYMYMIAL